MTEEEKLPEELPEEEERAQETPAPDPVVEELKKTKEQLLRLAAEFENFRKRSQRERGEIARGEKIRLLGAFLPVLDNFERAVSADASAEEFRKGVEMIYAQLDGVFSAEGAESFGAPGDSFDPALHHAVAHAQNPELGENVISQVLSRGWRTDEKLIREAMVCVAN